MDDLVGFLRAQLDEDAEAARLADAVDPGPWYEDVEDGTYTNQRSGLDGVGLVRAADNIGLWDREQSAGLSMAGVTATHIARHDPARALCEAAVKRQFVEEYASALADRAALRAEMRTVIDTDRDAFARMHREESALIEKAERLESVVRALAGVYADHPGYRPEWAATA